MEKQSFTIVVIYFSPTHSSGKTAKAIASGMGEPRRKIVDLTLDEKTDDILVGEGELAVICVPVYAGRVAPVAAERLSRLKADGTPAVIAVSYGNRDYDDALVELYDIAVAAGFKPVAAGAFIGEHSYSRKDMPVAAGRPDAADIEIAKRFGRDCMRKLLSGNVGNDLRLKGNRPYRDVKPSPPVAPHSTGDCAGCGECINVCPTHAISLSSGALQTDAEKCVRCCACVKYCPIGARVFDTPFTEFLYKNFSVRREPELFI